MANISAANAAVKLGSFAQFRANLLKSRPCCLRNLHHCIMHTLEHLSNGLPLAQHHVEPCRQLFYNCASSKRGHGLLKSFNVAPQNGSKEENDDTVINLVHWVPHAHLVRTEAMYKPKRILHQMRPSDPANTIVALDSWAGMTATVGIKCHNSVAP